MLSKCIIFFIYCLLKLNLNIRHASMVPLFSPSCFAEKGVQGLTGATLGWLECTRIWQKEDFGQVPWAMRATFSVGGSSPLLLHSAGLSVAERLHTMTSNYKPVAAIHQPGSSSSSQTWSSANCCCGFLCVVTDPHPNVEKLQFWTTPGIYQHSRMCFSSVTWLF